MTGRGAELVDLFARAQARAVEQGYTSRGTRRELHVQAIAICKPEHPRWRLAAGGPLVCAVCHPPAPGLDVIRLERWDNG